MIQGVDYPNQILQTNIIGIVLQTVRRITNEILGVKELKEIVSSYLWEDTSLELMITSSLILRGLKKTVILEAHYFCKKIIIIN